MTETCKKEKSEIGSRLPNGQFAPGHTGNVKGSNKYVTIVPLVKALEASGKRYKEPFWDFVARKARTSDTVLNAILKKLLPDKIEGTGFTDKMQIFIVTNGKANDPKGFIDRIKGEAKGVSG